jgi:hypothetical protein
VAGRPKQRARREAGELVPSGNGSWEPFKPGNEAGLTSTPTAEPGCEPSRAAHGDDCRPTRPLRRLRSPFGSKEKSRAIPQAPLAAKKAQRRLAVSIR